MSKTFLGHFSPRWRASSLLSRNSLVSLVLVFLALAVLNSAAEPSFTAGTARRDITPKEPVPMWGYGARRAALSEGTLDPLHAIALVMEANGKKLAIVGLDLGRSPSERSLQQIRGEIKKRAGIEHSYIAGSHTHHGPVLELTDAEGKGRGPFDPTLRYYREMEQAIVDAIIEADGRRVPAKIGSRSAPLDGFNRNRHTKIEPKPVDRDLTVLRVEDLSGRALAVLVNFAAHPTMIPAATMKFSADYVGAMRKTVETEVGAPVIFMQGASGDLSANAGGRQGHEAFGQALGREVLQLMADLTTDEPKNPSLAVREERFTFASRVNFSSPLVLATYSLAFFPELVANYAEEYAQGVRPRLTVAILNNRIAMVGVSGEVFCNHAIRLKERFRGGPVFFFGCSNGYHQYFPTIEAVAEGGYGADKTVSPVAVGAGEQLMNTALLWLYEMSGQVR